MTEQDAFTSVGSPLKASALKLGLRRFHLRVNRASLWYPVRVSFPRRYFRSLRKFETSPRAEAVHRHDMTYAQLSFILRKKAIDAHRNVLADVFWLKYMQPA